MPRPLTAPLQAGSLALLVLALIAAAAVVPATAAPGRADAAANADCRGWLAQLQARRALAAPAGTAPAAVRPRGASVLPNGRFVTPAGRTLRVAPHPYGLAVSPDGATVVTANSGTAPFSVSVLTGANTARPTVRQIPPGVETEPDVLNAVFMGLAVAPDNRTLYVSGGDDGTIAVLDLRTGRRTGTFDLDVPFGGRPWRDSYVGDLTLAPDKRTIWALDQANFRVVAVDSRTGKVVRSARAGRYPFGLALTPDGKTAYVANVGAFEYSFVRGWQPTDPTSTGLTFPPFGYDTERARNGTVVEGKQVPGVGPPNHLAAFSVWAIDTATGRVRAKLKTGPLVGEPVGGIKAIGGSAPNSVVTDGRFAYVSNNHSDTVAVIDVRTNRVVAEIPLQPTPLLGRLRGVLPFGLALSPDGRRLYVAESGINSVAVIDTATRRVLGHVPTGWYPSRVRLSPDGRRMFVTSAKGFGSGPNGGPGFVPGPEGTYIGRIQKGTVSLVDLPAAGSGAERRALAGWTSRVLANNGFVPRTGRPVVGLDRGGKGSCPIQHVIFVTKENRTFDEVYGDRRSLGGQQVEGEPSLARFGRQAKVSNADGTRVVRDVNVMPNHQALAERFALSDNTYVDSDVSADGHRWLVGAPPDAFVETSWAASYGGRRHFDYESSWDTSFSAPGRRGFTEANSALHPEDYPEAGSIWENFARTGTSFRNWGEGFEFAGISENPGYEPTGARLPVNVPMPRPLFHNTSRTFPTYNTNIPDQYRIQQFADEFRDLYASGRRPLPAFLNVYLPNDHGAGDRPEDGYPFYASYMADNDLALGKLVQLVSHSRFWRSTAILVTEDDSQDGLDHVDAHRTVQLVISPWVKPGTLLRQHTSIASNIKTINLLLGTPFLNQYDAAATDLLGAFTDQPDVRPYDAVPTDPRIFDPAKVEMGGFTAEELEGGADLDDIGDFAESHERQAAAGRDDDE